MVLITNSTRRTAKLHSKLVHIPCLAKIRIHLRTLLHHLKARKKLAQLCLRVQHPLHPPALNRPSLPTTLARSRSFRFHRRPKIIQLDTSLLIRITPAAPIHHLLKIYTAHLKTPERDIQTTNHIAMWQNRKPS